MNTTLNNNNTLLAKSTSFITVILKGLGQIMLQENSITGLLFLIGIFYGSLAMGFAALLATICGTAIAYLLKYDKTEVNQGLYGFSAALVGVAVMLFLKPVLWAWVIVVIGAVLAAMLQHFFIKRKFPAFTFPFVLVTWLILLVCNSFFTDLLATPALAVEHISDSLSDGFKSFGQVIFQSSLLSGLLFFLAVFISSPISALYGLAAAIISAIMAYYFSIPINEINLGLYGFNAVLCAIIFAGTKVKDGVWVLISLVLSLAISLLMLKIGITKLTFPFVLATWITLFLKSRLSFEK
ncbi:MAG: Urea transporter [Bacteroidetes bacterium ADurb.BinA174]|nr:MAG: Urea transporter [Bacteroidetes bacterium ADurb.BinA174]